MKMQKAIIGKKVGMTQIFDESGKVIPVTVIEAGPCVVTQKKTTEKDGYSAIQLGYEDVKESKLSKPEAGHLKKADVAMKKHLKEFRIEKAEEKNVGDVITASVFAVGDKIDVTGVSKGHGYEGPVKRCGGHRTPMTHGGGPVHRQAGSMGSTSSPSRIFKGHHGAGQMGNEQVTVENDGYSAVQLGYEDVKESKLTKPELGHLKKAEVALKKHLKEFRVEKAAEMNVGDEIKASVFAVGDKVDVTGISKGHGYEGPVKRCGGHRTPMTHGGGPVHRQAGSMGPTSSPSRIFKGHHGAGQMGVEQVTVENLDIVKVDDELNMIVVRGAIPGPKGGVVYIKNTVKNFKACNCTSNPTFTSLVCCHFSLSFAMPIK